MHQLIELKDPAELHALCALYRRDWPKHHVGFNTLRTYVRWLTAQPTLSYTHIYSLDGNWRAHGLYVIVDRYHLMLHSLRANDADLGIAMNLLDWQYGYKITAITQSEFPIVEAGVVALNIQVRLAKLLTYSMPQEKALQLSIDCPSAYRLGVLSAEHTEFVHGLWPARQRASIHYIKRLIQLNTTIALFERVSGELVGWCISCHCNYLGSLYVLEKYRRQGLATVIIKAYAQHMAVVLKEDTYVSVYHLNKTSQALFEKLNFESGEDVYHIRAYRVHEDDVWPYEDCADLGTAARLQF